ncbi:MAG: aminomethyltransferase family protein [bacterium]
MTEAATSITLRKSPLDSAHVTAGATMVERDGWSIPANYGDVAKEYVAVCDGAGLIDLSPRGRLLVNGSEAISFLNGLITNDMKTLGPNTWMPAAFPNVQGRLIASVRVIRLKDEGTGKTACPTFLIDTEAVTHDRVLKTIERFTLAGDFRVNDITSETAMLSVQGKKAATIISSVLGDEATNLTSNAVRQTGGQQGAVAEVTIFHAAQTGEDGFDLIIGNDHATALWNALQNAGAQPVGYDALEVLRIEAGVPRFGVDMDEANIVTETNLDDAVSYTKGCYIGQEIIARIKYRGHVAKKLSGLIFEGMVGIKTGALIKSIDDKEIGRITSVTHSPKLNQSIALGYLKYDYLAVGTRVKVVTDDRVVAAEVVELPFLRPN